MKLKTLLLMGLTSMTLAACNTTPKQPQVNLGVLETVENLSVYPNTKSNSAQLVKFPNYCIIEFAGLLEAGLANEKWQFQGNTLMAASSTIIAHDGSSTGQAFDLYDKEKQNNFLALKSHFKKQNMQLCD